MKNKTFSRRKFISKHLFSGAVMVGGALFLGSKSLLAAANESRKNLKNTGDEPFQQVKKGAQTPAKNPCDDMTGVAPAELEKRKKLAYVPKSPIPDNTCSSCALYLPPAAGKACGGCALFKGPVRPGGSCAYWAPANKD